MPLVKPKALAKLNDASRNPFMSSIDFNLFNSSLEQKFLLLMFINRLLSIALVDNGEIQRIVAIYPSRSFLNVNPFPGAPGFNRISYPPAYNAATVPSPVLHATSAQ